jgi:hypothetical protein
MNKKTWLLLLVGVAGFALALGLHVGMVATQIAWQREAVKLGMAEWGAAEDGDPVWQWKTNPVETNGGPAGDEVR